MTEQPPLAEPEATLKPGSEAVPRRPRLLRRPFRLVVILALAAIGAVLLLALRDAWRVGRDLKHGSELIETMSLADLGTENAVEQRVESAAAQIRKADSLAHHSRWFALVDAMPVVGHQIDALRELSAAASQLASIGDSAARDLSSTLNARVAAGPRRLEVLARLATRTAATERAIRRVRPPHHAWLAPPLAAAERRLGRGFQQAGAALATTTETLTSLRSLLTGPSRLLVLAGSNAEMRAGMGMPLHAGIVTIDDGRLQASPFQPTSDLLLGKPVPLPPDLKDLYGWLDPGAEWRNTASSANFPELGPVFTRLALAAGLGEVDGVISVDVRAIADLLRGLGPVEAYGVQIRGDNAERMLLHDVYLRPELDSDLRHQVLGTVAEAVFSALGERPISPRELAGPLVAAAQGRHLMAWANKSALQGAWESLGVAGKLDAEGLLIAVQNHGGYKLDWYLRCEATLQVTRTADRRRVELALDVSNPAPTGLPDIVAGSPLPDLPFGSYRAFVTFYLPKDASRVDLGGREVIVGGADGPMNVVAVRFDVRPGATESVDLSFEIPAEESLRLMPSARVHPIVVHLGDHELTDATTVRLW